jgi:hypothetical protein
MILVKSVCRTRANAIELPLYSARFPSANSHFSAETPESSDDLILTVCGDGLAVNSFHRRRMACTN